MADNIGEYYNKIYSENKNTFGAEPLPIVKKVLEFLHSGTVLDLGAGEGRNSLFLVSHGFQVTAVDASSVAIEKIKKEAESRGFPITTDLKDILEFEWKQSYDLIIAAFVLHFLKTADANKVINHMKANTNPGGYNVITAMTKQGDFFVANPETPHFYPSLEELKEIYHDWEVVTAFEKKTLAISRNPDGSPMSNVFAGLVARKPM